MKVELEREAATVAEPPVKGRMPRVLMVATVGISVRGALIPFARHFRGKGWRVDAMARGIGDYEECRANFDRIWDASWSRNPLDPRNLTVAPGQVRKAVAEGQYDMVHVHTPVAAFVTRYALRNLKRNRPKIVYTAHGFHFHPGGGAIPNFVFRTLEKTAGAWTDYLVVMNRADEEACGRDGIVSPGRLLHIRGIGIDTRRFSKERVSATEIEAIRREMGLASSAKLFLMVGELASKKRPADVLRAFALLKERDYHLAFAGSGGLLMELERLAARLGVDQLVHFLGFRRDMPALMRAATAVLLPSEREGLPLCIMEAMSLEVPVIASNIRGNSDLLEDGCGVLVPLGDRLALAAAMERVAADPVKAARMCSAARRRIAEHDVEKIKAAYDLLYEGVLAA
jgi:glycosyltransferase involved in cell wall biosynthesis